MKHKTILVAIALVCYFAILPAHGEEQLKTATGEPCSSPNIDALFWRPEKGELVRIEGREGIWEVLAYDAGCDYLRLRAKDGSETISFQNARRAHK